MKKVSNKTVVENLWIPGSVLADLTGDGHDEKELRGKCYKAYNKAVKHHNPQKGEFSEYAYNMVTFIMADYLAKKRCA